MFNLLPAEVTGAGPMIALGSLLIGSMGIPVPTLAPLIFAGSMIATSHGSPQLAIAILLAGTAIAVAGDLVWFAIGRRFGTRILGLLCRLSLSRDSCVRRTADLFVRQGVRLLLFIRFVPGLAIMSAPLAGATGVTLGRFVLFDIAGAALWIAVGLAAGYSVADQIGRLLGMLRHVGLDLGGAVIVAILLYVTILWIRRHLLYRRLRMARLTAPELAALLAQSAAPVTILDVRSGLEQAADPFVIPGARLFGSQDLAIQAAEFSPLAPVVIYCSCPNEVSAATVARQLRKLGFTDVRPLRDGLDGWRAAGFGVAPLSPPPVLPPGLADELRPLVASGQNPGLG